MVLPNVNVLEIQVRALVDYCISKKYSFTCWDITRQLQHHYLGQTIDHNAVRAAVEKYFFSYQNTVNGAGFNSNAKYNREVTYNIERAPQVYKSISASVASYDKDFLDPIRVERPLVVEKTLVEKVKDEPTKSVGIVYAVKHKIQDRWATPPGRWCKTTTDLSKAGFWGSKNSPTQKLKYLNKNDYEIVTYNLS